MMMMMLLLQPLSLLQLPAWPLLPLLPLLLLLGWARRPASHNLMACVCVLILAHSSKRIFVSFMHKTTRARIFLVCEKKTCTFCGQTWVYESTTSSSQNHPIRQHMSSSLCSQRTASLLRQCILHGDKEARQRIATRSFAGESLLSTGRLCLLPLRKNLALIWQKQNKEKITK